jgi:hypothetical protein
VIAGRTFTVQQEAAPSPPPPPPPAPCEYSIKPTYYNSGAGPDEVRVDVAAAAGCAWSVNGEPSWVTVAEGRTGSGNGTVRLTIPPNPGGPRNANFTIAGQQFALSQAGGCAATLKPTFYNSGRGPDDIQIAVTAPAGCQWTASSPVDWATIQYGASGSGDGTVGVHVKPNNEDSRSVILTIAGQRFTLTQQGR